MKYCPPCVIALHHFVDYTGQAISQGKLSNNAKAKPEQMTRAQASKLRAARSAELMTIIRRTTTENDS
jgi:hypothetical protein